MEDQESEYSKFKRLAEYAAADILTKFQDVLNGMGYPFLFRARIDPWRIKSESSLARKAKHQYFPRRSLPNEQEISHRPVSARNGEAS